MVSELLHSKAAAKHNKSGGAVKQGSNKRKRVSTESMADSDEEEPEQFPITKKQRKSTKKGRRKSTKKGRRKSTKKSTEKESTEEESIEEEDFDSEGFVVMDRYMKLKTWDSLVKEIGSFDVVGEGYAFVSGTL